MKTLVLGLGNPILSDDAVGLLVARSLYERIGGEDVDLIEAAASGLQTIQMLSGYDRAVIVDSILDGAAVGQVRRLDADELEGPPLLSSHRVSLGQAVQLARNLRLSLPESILVYAVTVADPFVFGERPTPELERALPSATDQIACDLKRCWGLG